MSCCENPPREEAANPNVDCEAGRKMGCNTFCCRLLVRLQPHEMVPNEDGGAAKGFVDKTPDGYCVHLDQENNLCAIWENRPQTCREYSCNTDVMLQVVLREGITNIAEVAKRSVASFIPKETYINIPLNDEN